MLRIEVACWGVLFRRQKFSRNPRTSMRFGGLCQMGEECRFHCSANDAAAQQERVDLALGVFDARDGHADQSVVAEPVSHFDGHNPPSRPRGRLRNLLFRVAPRGQIELIGLLG
jgi:hypothetical protein